MPQLVQAAVMQLQELQHDHERSRQTESDLKGACGHKGSIGLSRLHICFLVAADSDLYWP